MKMVGALILALFLSGCAHVERADQYLSSVESRTWIAHSTGAAASVMLTDVAFEEPWWGYGIYMGIQIGWEANEYLTRQKYGINHSKSFNTFMDLFSPAVTGWLFAKLLEDDEEPQMESGR